MKSISISRAKTWEYCKLQYSYIYVDKFVPVEQKPIYVQAKGLVLHQTFENLLKYENYKNDVPSLPYRQAEDSIVLKYFQEAMEENKLPIGEAKEYNLKLGIKRWLSFKHDYLDKTNHIMYSEKQYNENLFGETKTITILDLLEDCGNNNFIIYDYKTPQTIDMKRYKDQLVLYAYSIAVVKNIIEKESTDYQKVVDHFKLKVFFPLMNGAHETFEKCLVDLPFKASDIENIINKLKNTCNSIDAFDFNKPAEVLQLSTPGFMCKWCAYCGSKAQPDVHTESGKTFAGCPITNFLGMPATNESFKVAD